MEPSAPPPSPHRITFEWLAFLLAGVALGAAGGFLFARAFDTASAPKNDYAPVVSLATPADPDICANREDRLTVTGTIRPGNFNVREVFETLQAEARRLDARIDLQNPPQLQSLTEPIPARSSTSRSPAYLYLSFKSEAQAEEFISAVQRFDPTALLRRNTRDLKTECYAVIYEDRVGRLIEQEAVRLMQTTKNAEELSALADLIDTYGTGGGGSQIDLDLEYKANIQLTLSKVEHQRRVIPTVAIQDLSVWYSCSIHGCHL